MKSRNGVFTLLAALLIVAVAITLVSWVLSLGNQNISIQTSAKKVDDEKAPGPTNGFSAQKQECKEAIENFKNPDDWPYFNRDYQNLSYKRFRFKYPPALEVKDIDSGEIQLKKNNEFCLIIDEIFPLTKFPRGDTPDEKFRAFYFDEKRIYKDNPDLTFERIDLGENTFLYKVPYDGGESYFLGEIDGNGIKIIDYGSLPYDVVYNIIQSIEFK